MLGNSTHGKIFYVVLLIIIVTLPLQTNVKVGSAAIGLLLLNWIVEGNYRHKISTLISNKLLLLFMGVYMLHALSLVYTTNIQDGLFDLERKLTLLIFPLVIGTSLQHLNQKSLNDILSFFVVVCFIYASICFGHGLFQLIVYKNKEFLFHHKLSQIIGMHAIYFAMYICFALFVLLYQLFSGWQALNPIRKTLYTIVTFYFLTIILLSSARIVYLAFGVLAVISIVYAGIKTQKLKQALILLVIGGVLGLTTILTVKPIKNRFKDIFQSRLDNFNNRSHNTGFLTKGNSNGLTLRLVKWRCSWEVITKTNTNIMVGIGAGDADDALQECYKTSLWEGAIRYNAHNQYLQVWIGLGIVGLVIFIISLTVPMYTAYLNKQYIYFIFLILFAICCLTESMLNSEKGVVFYALFNSLLLFYNNNKSADLTS